MTQKIAAEARIDAGAFGGNKCDANSSAQKAQSIKAALGTERT